MTTEPMRPARIAGLALLGVAAVATVLGVVTLIGGDGDSEAGPTTPPAATTTATEPPAGTTSGTRPPTTTAPPATTTTQAPPSTSTTTSSEPTARPTTPGGGDTPSSQDQPVRVYNNSTITGLADKAKADIEAAGWDVVEVGNHQGRLHVTTVYFRPGTAEEAAAKALGKQFDLRVEPRFDGIADASPGVIVIVTKDWTGAPNDKG